MSPSRTGPLTLRMMERFGSSMNSTRTWVTLPVLPVRPSTRLIFASLIGAVSMVVDYRWTEGVCGGGRRGRRFASAAFWGEAGLARATGERATVLARRRAAETTRAHSDECLYALGASRGPARAPRR